MVQDCKNKLIRVHMPTASMEIFVVTRDSIKRGIQARNNLRKRKTLEEHAAIFKESDKHPTLTMVLLRINRTYSNRDSTVLIMAKKNANEGKALELKYTKSVDWDS